MNTLLIFFAFPVAVIIISAILEKLLRNPIAVAGFIFAIFLIVTFAAFDETFLIATLVYTIIAFVTALIVHLLKCRREREHNLCDLLLDIIRNNNDNSENNNKNTNNCNNHENIVETVEELISNNAKNNSNSNINTCNCVRNRYRRW